MTDRENTKTAAAGTLYVVGTPIGNLEDISYRAVRILGEVDLIAAEDTRKARILLGRYAIKTPTLSFFAGQEAQQTEKVLRKLQGGLAVALISEAGMPGLSDPGYPLLRGCVAAGIAIDVIPGPSALTTALLLSGLPLSRFRYLGFLPRKGQGRSEAIRALVDEPDTAVLFESPQRTGQTLSDLAAALGPRDAALAREMTKQFQEVVRDTLPLLAQRYADAPPRGEVTLVIAGRPEQPMADAELEQHVRDRLAAGESPKTIRDALGASASRRRAYQLALKLKT